MLFANLRQPLHKGIECKRLLVSLSTTWSFYMRCNFSMLTWPNQWCQRIESFEVVIETLNVKCDVNTWCIELESSPLDEPTWLKPQWSTLSSMSTHPSTLSKVTSCLENVTMHLTKIIFLTDNTLWNNARTWFLVLGYFSHHQLKIEWKISLSHEFCDGNYFWGILCFLDLVVLHHKCSNCTTTWGRGRSTWKG